VSLSSSSSKAKQCFNFMERASTPPLQSSTSAGPEKESPARELRSVGRQVSQGGEPTTLDETLPGTDPSGIYPTAAPPATGDQNPPPSHQQLPQLPMEEQNRQLASLLHLEGKLLSSAHSELRHKLLERHRTRSESEGSVIADGVNIMTSAKESTGVGGPFSDSRYIELRTRLLLARQGRLGSPTFVADAAAQLLAAKKESGRGRNPVTTGLDQEIATEIGDAGSNYQRRMAATPSPKPADVSGRQNGEDQVATTSAERRSPIPPSTESPQNAVSTKPFFDSGDQTPEGVGADRMAGPGMSAPLTAAQLSRLNLLLPLSPTPWYAGRSKCTTDTRDVDLSEGSSIDSDVSTDSDRDLDDDENDESSSYFSPSTTDGSPVYPYNTKPGAGGLEGGVGSPGQGQSPGAGGAAPKRKWGMIYPGGAKGYAHSPILTTADDANAARFEPQHSASALFWAHPTVVKYPQGTSITCLALSDRNATLAIGSSHGTILLVEKLNGVSDFTSLDQAVPLPGSHTDSVTDLTWNQGGYYLLSIGLDAFAICWDVEKRARVRQFSTQYPPLATRFLPFNNNMMLVALRSPAMRVYNLSTGKLMTKIKCRTTVGAVAMDTNGEYLFAGDNSGTLSIFTAVPETAEVSRRREFVVQRGKPITCLSWTRTPPGLQPPGAPTETHLVLANTRGDSLFLLHVDRVFDVIILHKFEVPHVTLNIRSCFAEALRDDVSVVVATGSEDGVIRVVRFTRNKAEVLTSSVVTQTGAALVVLLNPQATIMISGTSTGDVVMLPRIAVEKASVVSLSRSEIFAAERTRRKGRGDGIGGSQWDDGTGDGSESDSQYSESVASPSGS
jgi:WD40 repeat protein